MKNPKWAQTWPQWKKDVAADIGWFTPIDWANGTRDYLDEHGQEIVIENEIKKRKE